MDEQPIIPPPVSTPTPGPTPTTLAPAMPSAPKKRMSPWPVLIIALVAAYSVYASYSGMWPFATKVAISPPTTPSPSISATPDVTANWKTYQSGTSGKFSYEFKYPAEWPTPKSTQEEVYSVVSLGPIAKAYYGDSYATSFSVTTAPLSVFGSDADETPEKLLASLKTPGYGTLISDTVRNDGIRIITYHATGMYPTIRIELFYPATSPRQFHASFMQVGEDASQLQTIASTFKFTK